MRACRTAWPICSRCHPTNKMRAAKRTQVPRSQVWQAKAAVPWIWLFENVLDYSRDAEVRIPRHVVLYLYLYIYIYVWVCVCLYRIKYSLYMIWTRQCRSCPADAPTDQCLFGAKAKPGNPCRGSITQGARPYRGSSKPTLTCPQNARKKEKRQTVAAQCFASSVSHVFQLFESCHHSVLFS